MPHELDSFKFSHSMGRDYERLLWRNAYWACLRNGGNAIAAKWAANQIVLDHREASQ